MLTRLVKFLYTFVEFSQPPTPFRKKNQFFPDNLNKICSFWLRADNSGKFVQNIFSISKFWKCQKYQKIKNTENIIEEFIVIFLSKIKFPEMFKKTISSQITKKIQKYPKLFKNTKNNENIVNFNSKSEY